MWPKICEKMIILLEMKSLCFIIMLSMIIACKSDGSNSVVSDTTDSLDVDDYAELVRHPISLSSNIDTSVWSQITFEENEFEFDTVAAGEVVVKSFEFTNSGSKPLYILDTRVSCGCTVAAYDSDAITPGESGKIEVEFNTYGKKGEQNKSIIVLSNSHPNEDRLTIRGFVK
jgi:hypothetical protein